MKRLILAGLIATIFLSVGACVPKRIVWSPDGSMAMVMGENGVYLSDPKGKLVRILDHTPPQTLTRPANAINTTVTAVWLGDSEQVVLVTIQTIRSWAEIKCLTEEYQDTLANRLKKFEAEVLSGKDSNGLLPGIAKGTTSDQEGKLVQFYFTQHLSPEVKKKIGNRWNDFRVNSIELHLLQRYTLGKTSLHSPITLAQSIHDIREVRSSPDGRFVAYTEGKEDDSTNLMLTGVDGKTDPRLVEKNVNWYFDWTSNGRSLVYIKKGAEVKSPALGIVARRQVRDDRGQLLGDFKTHDLAGLIYGDLLRVQCLSDGRILFSAIPVKLPCTTQELPETGSLFMLDPGKYSRVIPVVSVQAESTVGERLTWFEPSPDGRFISLPGEDGTLLIMELSTGKTTEIQTMKEPGTGKDNIKLRTVPVWRNNEELCFAVPPGSTQGSPHRAEIVLYSIKDQKIRCISKNWPDSAVRNFLTEK